MPPSRSGVRFANRLSEEAGIENDHLLIGSGVALGDVDGDGRIDIYLNRLEGPNALYRNLGDWRFEEITAAAGIEANDRFSTGAALADVDGDGDLDLLTTALGGPNALYLNDGSGRFEDATEWAGLTSDLGSTTLALADVDGDGDLDLYVANYKKESAADVLRPFERRNFSLTVRDGDSLVVAEPYREHFRIESRNGRKVAMEQAEPDWLYLNDGSGRFERVSWTSGGFLDVDGRPYARAVDDFALAARFFDADGDLDPDIYVCDDFDDPDHFWINDGTGRFREAPALTLRSTSNASMAVDFGDLDRDGSVDFFVADMRSADRTRRHKQRPLHAVFAKRPGEITNRPQFQRNTLFWNRGDATFAQIAEYAGVEASEWSWSALILDVDLDGWEDVLVGNGHVRDMRDADAMERIAALRGSATWDEAKLLYPELATRNVAFRNRGDLTFEEVGESWGFGREPDISHGMATGDLDDDGDLDLVVNRLGRPAALLRNTSGRARVAVRLVGALPNTGAIGAKVSLDADGLPLQTREVTAGGLYLSSSGPTLSFAAERPSTGGDGSGAPAGERTMRLRVTWRDGGVTTVDSVRPNRLYEIRKPPGGGDRPPETHDAPTPFFEDVTARLGHRHTENEYDDFRRQPLLVRHLSRLGPGVTWADLDADGDPDLLISSAAGGSPALYRNQGGRFEPADLSIPGFAHDQTTVLAASAAEGRGSVLIGVSNYEAASPGAALEVPGVVRARIPSRGAETAPGGGDVPLVSVAPPAASSTGPLAQADVDGDGDLDLFVGGRVIPAAYPAPASSRLFRNDGAGYTLDEANEEVFAELGMVSSATFSDLDADGDPDLVLAVDWGPIRAFRNQRGRFREVTVELDLAAHTSRWLGVATGDLDGDGRLDIVATSWGHNTRYQPTETRPVVLYGADFDNDGRLDPIEAQAEPGTGRVYPLDRFERLRSAIPAIQRRVPDYPTYAEADLEEVLGEAAGGAPRLEAASFSHRLFLNRGDAFEAIALPAMAQFAPAHHPGVGDFDGDGHEDLFLSQNLFATEPTTPRYDGGRGLWLRGDGAGGLEPIPGHRSGVEVYGDGRGAAMADFDGDGRADLAVAQNGAATRLFRNRGAKPGLRVRLVGPPGNRDAVGAAMRVAYGDRRGPVREIHSGAGYWSSDDPVQVLGLQEEPSGLWIRWPGGIEETVPIETGNRELVVVFEADNDLREAR